MNRKNLTLLSRIEKEIKDIDLLIDKISSAWERVQETDDPFFIDSVALNLHGFYSALERIFLTIAKEIDGYVPKGHSWHYELLLQMNTPINKIRPAILSSESCKNLDEYRGFCHIVRNVYSFNLSRSRIEPLVIELPSLFEQIKGELFTFTRLIEENS
jgi:hypothetical protein